MFSSRLRLKAAFVLAAILGALAGTASLPAAAAAAAFEQRLDDSARVLESFTADEEHAIPAELLARARGVAVIPNLIRGGLIVGGRRGHGVIVVRSPDGTWSNPAPIALTGGSIGWQIGVESADLVLVFANDRSVRHIARGKFTLGGDASAVAGPVGRHSTAALTGKAEIYAYFRSEGLYAGAAFEGARLNVDLDEGRAFYAGADGAEPLGRASAATPEAARHFLNVLEKASVDAGERLPGDAGPGGRAPADGAAGGDSSDSSDGGGDGVVTHPLP